MLKIALFGSAPSSVALGPFTDPTWLLWGCSPGAYPHFINAKRSPNAWFELHKWEPGKPWFQPEYIQWMRKIQGPVYTAAPVPDLPNSVIYPFEEMLNYEYSPPYRYTDDLGNERTNRFTFGPFFWTSSLSYMFAMAIASGAHEIGLWGVDMSAEEEWNFQRSGCHYFIWLAKSLGIKVTLPPESDLIRPPPPYALCEQDHMHVKQLEREKELVARVTELDRQIQAHTNERMFLVGAMNDLKYQMKTWVHHPKAIELAMNGPAPLSAEDVIDPLAEAAIEVEVAKANGHAEPEEVHV